MDESGIPLDPRPPNVVTKREQKKVRYRVSGKKEQIPPMIIFEGKYLNHLWTQHEVPGTFYGISGKNGQTKNFFRQWLTNHFIK